MSDMLYRGSLPGNTGSHVPQTAGVDGGMRIQAAHGTYVDSAMRGFIYAIDSDTVTLAAANTTKGVLGTIKFINGFYNPITSGYCAAILSCAVDTVSGTPAGPYFYNFFTNKVPTNAQTGTIRCTLLNGATSGSVMVSEVGVVLAVLAADTTTAGTQFSVVGGPAAIAAGAGLYHAYDDVQGKIIIPPGTMFGITAVGAGTSHVVQSTLMWEEIPYLT